MALHEHETLDYIRTRKTRDDAKAGESRVDPMPISNTNLARMLQREPEETEEETVLAKHDPSARPIQRESADEEEEVLAKHDASVAQRHPATVDELQREEADEEEVLAKHDTTSSLAQRAPEVGLAGGAVSDHVSSRINSARGGGTPLDNETQSTMEDALGTSLGNVRVHVGAESDELNHAISAKAFTTGNDVFVRSDQWAPGSSETQRLMAHELTHVAQQREGVGTGESGMTVGAAETAEEHEADAVADAVTRR